MNMKLLPDTPRNNEIYRLKGSEAVKVSALPAKWLVVVYNDDFAYLTEVFQKETSGMGFLKRTISNRRCQKRFKMFCISAAKAPANCRRKSSGSLLFIESRNKEEKT